MQRSRFFSGSILTPTNVQMLGWLKEAMTSFPLHPLRPAALASSHSLGFGRRPLSAARTAGPDALPSCPRRLQEAALQTRMWFPNSRSFDASKPLHQGQQSLTATRCVRRAWSTGSQGPYNRIQPPEYAWPERCRQPGPLWVPRPMLLSVA